MFSSLSFSIPFWHHLWPPFLPPPSTSCLWCPNSCCCARMRLNLTQVWMAKKKQFSAHLPHSFFFFLCKAYSHVVQGYLRVPSFIPDTYCIGVWYKLLPKICSDAEASQNGGPKMLSHTHRTHPVEQKWLTSSWQAPRLWSHSAVMNKIPHLISCIFAPLISSSTFRATSNKDYRKEKILKV